MTSQPQRAIRSRWLFVATILAGSFLLFLVQPLVARMALPRLGGAPAVWNSAMLVYQALLLGGYAYAHAIGRFAIRTQALIHIAVLVLAGLTLPFALADLPPPASGLEALWVPLLFLATIGPVFFAVSAQAPLMQRWYAADRSAGDPYWLYAASNLGSFTGLIAYPVLVEPSLSLGMQSIVWSAGYGALVLLVIFAARARWQADSSSEDLPAGEVAEPIGWRRIALWLALAAVPSGLMLSTTTHLTTDIVAMPLLWVIPLGLYLLSFVFAFNEHSRIGHILTRIAPVVLLLTGAMAMVSSGADSLATGFATITMLLVVAVALHRRLFNDRPPPERLTLFYLVMSAGGALGGLFTALLAPLLFDWVWEHPILVLAALALLPDRPLIGWMDRLGLDPRARRVAVLAIVLVVVVLSGLISGWVIAGRDTLVIVAMTAGAVGGILLLGKRWAVVAVLLALMLGRGGYQTLASSVEGARERSYFGVYTVREEQLPGARGLTHGTTLHGLQFTGKGSELAPTTYYGADTGVGAALENLAEIAGEDARVGVVGLGVGTLACYRTPDQQYEFFEIDPLVLEFSERGQFTFLRECAPQAPIHIGDARLELERSALQSFDALVIDAFSSDAIPLHLVTSEAFALYASRLDDDGLMAVHISNRFIDLRPMIAALAREHGFSAAVRIDREDLAPGISPSMWVVLSRDDTRLKRLRELRSDLQWEELPEPAEQVWTDDFASILPYIQWRNVLGY